VWAHVLLYVVLVAAHELPALSTPHRPSCKNLSALAVSCFSFPLFRVWNFSLDAYP
jgi:hypothetical protein